MTATDQVRGLEVAEGGLRVALDTPELPRAATAPLRFRILDSDGAAVRDFDVEHTRRMHLIVVRRDLTGFQHLHPRLARDGIWSVAARLPAAGSYRVFADFARDDENHTLASDLRVDGEAALDALPPAAAVATTDGYAARFATTLPTAGRYRLFLQFKAAGRVHTAAFTREVAR